MMGYVITFLLIYYSTSASYYKSGRNVKAFQVASTYVCTPSDPSKLVKDAGVKSNE